MTEHYNLSRRALIAAVRNHPGWWAALGEPDHFDAGELDDRERLIALYGQHAQEAWWTNEVVEKATGTWASIQGRRRDLRSLVRDLIQHPETKGRLWEDTSEGSMATPALQQMLDIPHRVNNQLLHHTSMGVANYVGLEEGAVVFGDLASDDWIPQAEGFALSLIHI